MEERRNTGKRRITGGKLSNEERFTESYSQFHCSWDDQSHLSLRDFDTPNKEKVSFLNTPNKKNVCHFNTSIKENTYNSGTPNAEVSNHNRISHESGKTRYKSRQSCSRNLYSSPTLFFSDTNNSYSINTASCTVPTDPSPVDSIPSGTNTVAMKKRSITYFDAKNERLSDSFSWDSKEVASSTPAKRVNPPRRKIDPHVLRAHQQNTSVLISSYEGGAEEKQVANISGSDVVSNHLEKVPYHPNDKTVPSDIGIVPTDPVTFPSYSGTVLTDPGKIPVDTGTVSTDPDPVSCDTRDNTESCVTGKTVSVPLLGLDPLFWSYVKLKIHTIFTHFTKSSSISGLFLCGNHPITKVEVVGIITSFDKRDKYYKISVEDTTGCLEGVKWKNSSTGSNPASDPYPVDSVAIGDLVCVKGKLSDFRDIPEIKIYQIFKIDDLNTLTVHLIRCDEIYRNALNTVFTYRHTLVPECREKLRAALLDTIASKGAATNISEYKEIPAIKTRLECLKVLCDVDEEDYLTQLISEILSSSTTEKLQDSRRLILEKVKSILEHADSVKLSDLVLSGRFTGTDVTWVLNQLVEQGDLYETEQDGVYRKV